MADGWLVRSGLTGLAFTVALFLLDRLCTPRSVGFPTVLELKMQDPCPSPTARCPGPLPVWRRCLSHAVGAVATALALVAWATTPAEANPALTDQAARWLSAQLKVPADRITVQAPDPRWQMPACPSGLRFDTPFSNANTVRVRCESPQWQVFLRAQWPDDALPAAAPVAVSPARTDPGPSAATARAPAEPRRGVVLTRAVSRGSLLSPASVQTTQVPAREADSLLITDAQFLDQMEAVRDLPAGVPLRQTDIRPAVLVRQGQSVTMTVGQGTGFTITVRLEALQDGRLGERVMLRNAESGRTISGVVTGMNMAKGA